MKSAQSLFSRRAFLRSTAATLSVLAGLAFAVPASANDDHDRDHDRNQHWVASWATSPAAFFVYVPPVPQNQALAPSPTRFAAR